MCNKTTTARKEDPMQKLQTINADTLLYGREQLVALCGGGLYPRVLTTCSAAHRKSARVG